MDTSPEYIAMCQKAEEIQAQKPYPEDPYLSCVGDREKGYCDSLYWLPEEKSVEVLHWDNDEEHYLIGGYCSNATDAVWLPRQDQLQAMTGKEYPLQEMALTDFILSFEDPDENKPASLCKDNPLLTNLHSMEQLWLAFVMQENYSKEWTGQEWKESVHNKHSAKET